ncbi:MAG TPA: hypothetical protein VK166_12355 [Chitinophagaceae bacterium]|nr:hypothetical protein [Chitinophagaceae bacterium]
MYSREQIEQHIWDYIDGLCTPAEKEMVEKLLQSDPAWNTVYLELKDFNTLVARTDMIDEPSMRFTRNVMEQVAHYKIAPPAQSYVNKKIIYGIATFFIVTIVASILYGISLIDFSSSSAAGSVKLPEVDYSKYELNWSQYLNSPVLYIFLFMDVIAGLLLLDRYLRRKNEKLRETM